MWRMSQPIACILCSIDPNTTSLMLPMAQATVIAAPILLRDHVKRGARAVAGRLRDPRSAGSPAAAAGPVDRIEDVPEAAEPD